MPALEYGAAIESMVAFSPFGSFSSVVMSKKLMPGFGKSGTLRIICLRSMVNMLPLSNRKSLEGAACLFVHDGHAVDAGARRPPAQRLLHTCDRLLIALDERLDA